MPTLSFKLNGQPVSAEVENPTLLVDLLRTQLGLTGTHIGCDTAQCGCCTVMIDGLAVKSCSQLAMQAAGRDVTTIEGLAGEGGRLHPVQEAFVACHGLQCGYCTPGMVMSSLACLQQHGKPTREQMRRDLSGNLCRCATYGRVMEAIERTAQGGGK